MEDIKKLIKANVDSLEHNKHSDRVISYEDAKSRYAFLKNRAIVKVELTSGKSAEIDISDIIFEEGEN